MSKSALKMVSSGESVTSPMTPHGAIMALLPPLMFEHTLPTLRIYENRSLGNPQQCLVGEFNCRVSSHCSHGQRDNFCTQSGDTLDHFGVKGVGAHNHSKFA